MRAIHMAPIVGHHPVLVLTREVARGRLANVTVALITSTINDLPTEVSVGPRNGLDHDSVVNLDNIFTIRNEKLGRWVGQLYADQEPALHNAIMRAFDLDSW